MIKINEFAFCFFSNSVERVIEQEKEVDRLSSKYKIEKWYRHERVLGKYPSFSQMVNDAIDDTDSEFMIFCNPKTKFNSEDIEFILEKLSNGYCFASVVNFGFFGFSKELIRRVGMLDETFLNGEYEDNDFGIRLSHFGKAVYWKYDYSKYDSYRTKASNLMYITGSIFHNKYNVKPDVVLADKTLFNHKQISKRHRTLRQDIFESWKDKSNNFCDCFINQYLTKPVEIVIPNSIEKTIDLTLTIQRNKKKFRLELLCNDSIRVYYSVLKSYKDGRTCMFVGHLENNTWSEFIVFHENEMEIRFFINDNQFFVTMVDPEESLTNNLKIPTIIKWT
jgi:hypothetical protein